MGDIPVLEGEAFAGSFVDDEGFSFFAVSVGEFSIVGRRGGEEERLSRARDEVKWRSLKI